MPMKTLLSDDIPVPIECKFTPDMFFKQMRERKLTVGLVINLAYTDRFYDWNDLIDDHNVEYKHISCRGFNEAPQEDKQQEFIRVCNSFLSKNPRKLIAVHCTHGFNRTGFMICSYLCREREWALDAAVAHFATCRPPGIYKQDYLNALHNIFSDEDDPALTAPERPTWDVDDSLLASMDHFRGPGSINHHQARQFYEGIEDVHLVRDEALKHKIYNHCCMLVNYPVRGSQVSFPGAQPVSMDRTNISLLANNRYRVSWKADGERFMLYIQDEDNIFFLTRKLHLWRVLNIKFPRIDDLHAHLTDTLVDGEMVTDEHNDQKIPRYLIYDVIALNGVQVREQNFDRRCGKIKCVIVEARRQAKQANIIPREGEAFKVADKGFYMLHDARKTWDLNVTHEKDGLIFQPLDLPYKGGTCEEILKWKPPHLNSIDFRLVLREERQNGCLPETFACLHVSNRPEPMFKFKLDNSTRDCVQYNSQIVECVKNRGGPGWRVIRPRHDKLHPNSYETVQSIYKSITQPVTEEDLFTYIARIPTEPRHPPQHHHHHHQQHHHHNHQQQQQPTSR